MEEITHHLECIKPWKQRDKLPVNWCRIVSINSMFETSPVSNQKHTWILPLPKASGNCQQLGGYPHSSWCPWIFDAKPGALAMPMLVPSARKVKVQHSSETNIFLPERSKEAMLMFEMGCSLWHVRLNSKLIGTADGETTCSRSDYWWCQLKHPEDWMTLIKCLLHLDACGSKFGPQNGFFECSI